MILKKRFGDGDELSYSTSERSFIYQGKRIGLLDEGQFVIRFEDGQPVFEPEYLAYRKWVAFCKQVERVRRREAIQTDEAGKTDC